MTAFRLVLLICHKTVLGVTRNPLKEQKVVNKIFKIGFIEVFFA